MARPIASVHLKVGHARGLALSSQNQSWFDEETGFEGDDAA